MVCDLCGRDTELVSISVEGSTQNVCQSCSGYGTVIASPPIHIKRKARYPKQEPMLLILADSHQKIRKAREAHHLTQKELAAQLKERESLIQKVEGTLEPSIALARKLEKALKITLIEEAEPDQQLAPPPSTASAVTIGDLIKIKR